MNSKFCSLQKNSKSKRVKMAGSKDENGNSKAEGEMSSVAGNNPGEQTTKPEPPKDYIHVRARRGQATDSHSLAERVIHFALLPHLLYLILQRFLNS